jgi:hypothetical protein
MTNFIKQAEQNSINIAKTLADITTLLDAFGSLGHNFFNDYDTAEKDDYFQGLKLMRKAIYSKFTQKISQCFAFVGVGGKEAEKFSKQYAKTMFGDDAQVMHLLDKYGMMPSSWKTADQEEFRKELKDKLKN